MLSWPRGLISSPSTVPTSGAPSPTEYVTSFKCTPLPRTQASARGILTKGPGFPPPDAIGDLETGHLRLQAFDLPAPVAPAVGDPVVQPALPSLPELHDLGLDAVTTPERRARHLAPLVLDLEVSRTALHRPALLGGPRAEAAAARAAGVVGVGFSLRGPGDGPLYPHLTLELAPVEEQGRAGVLL